MELSDLLEYAKNTYHIEEEHKWADWPGFSVLSHPDTGKWIALYYFLLKSFKTKKKEIINT